MMKTEGESYSNYLNNVIDDHKEKNIKNICGVLLQSFCSKITGFSNFIFSYIGELLDYNFNQIDSFNNYSFLKKEDVIFALNISNEYQIDLGIFTYCILAFRALKYNQHM